MNACTHPLGHEWSDEDPELTWSRQFDLPAIRYRRATFHGVESVMVVCTRCNEIGYRIMAQDSGQREAS